MSQDAFDFDPDAPGSDGGLFGLPHTEEQAAVVVVPVPFDATTSYRRGTAQAPAAVHEASWQVDLHDLELGDFWRRGIVMQPEDPRFAQWNEAANPDALTIIASDGVDPDDPASVAAATRVNALSKAASDALFDKVQALFQAGKIPAVLGGDHSVALGAILAAAEQHPGLGVLQIDAHADLREAYEGFEFSHASVMHNVLETTPHVARLVQVGIRDVGSREMSYAKAHSERIRQHHDLALGDALAQGTTWQALCDAIVADLPPVVWISFDIDGLDPDLCPSTGTPVPGGLTWRQTLTLLRTLGRSGRTIVGFDLNEVNPGTTWDAIVGARLLYKLSGWAIASQS